MAEQRIDAYPVDKMGFLTSSGLRKKILFFCPFLYHLVAGGVSGDSSGNDSNNFPAKDILLYYSTINPLPKVTERKSLFQPIFKHVCKVQSSSTFKIFCYSFIEVQRQDLKHSTETETKHQLRWKRPLRDH